MEQSDSDDERREGHATERRNGDERRNGGGHPWPSQVELRHLIKDVHYEVMHGKIVGDRLTEETARHFRADEDLDRELLRRQGEFSALLREITAGQTAMQSAIKDIRSDMARTQELSVERHSTFVQSYFNGYPAASVIEMLHFVRQRMNEHSAQLQVISRAKGDILTRVALWLLGSLVSLSIAGAALYIAKIT